MSKSDEVVEQRTWPLPGDAVKLLEVRLNELAQLRAQVALVERGINDVMESLRLALGAPPNAQIHDIRAGFVMPE